MHANMHANTSSIPALTCARRSAWAGAGGHGRRAASRRQQKNHEAQGSHLTTTNHEADMHHPHAGVLEQVQADVAGARQPYVLAASSQPAAVQWRAATSKPQETRKSQGGTQITGRASQHERAPSHTQACWGRCRRMWPAHGSRLTCWRPPTSRPRCSGALRVHTWSATLHRRLRCSRRRSGGDGCRRTCGS